MNPDITEDMRAVLIQYGSPTELTADSGAQRLLEHIRTWSLKSNDHEMDIVVKKYSGYNAPMTVNDVHDILGLIRRWYARDTSGKTIFKNTLI